MEKTELDRLEHYHLNAPKFVGTNEGIKLYAEQTREELLKLIAFTRSLLEEKEGRDGQD